MKCTTMILVGCLAAGVGGNTALSQNNPQNNPDNNRIGAQDDAQKAGQNQKHNKKKAAQEGNLAHASQIMDMTVRNPQGKQIGEVEDMIIDSQGRVTFVILSFEDDFVSGDKLYAVPPKALRAGSDPKHKDLILSASKEKFTATSGFTEDNYPKFDEQSTRKTYSEFDQKPYWEGKMEDRNRDQRGHANPRSQPQGGLGNDVSDNEDNARDNVRDTRDNARDTRDNAQDNRDNRDNRGEPRANPHSGDADDARDKARDTRDTTRENADGAQDDVLDNRDNRGNPRADPTAGDIDRNRDNLTSAERDAQNANRDRKGATGLNSDATRQREYNQAPQFDSENAWTCRASKIIGKDVVNNDSTDLGNIEELLVDVSEHRVIYAVLSDGGTLSIGEKLTPIPYSALKASGDKEQFTIDATEESLKALSFEEDSWPDLTSSEWAERVHSEFNEDSYWAISKNNDGQSNRVDKHWQRDSTYNKNYDAKRTKTIKGEVTSVSEFTPEDGADKGRQLMVRSDDGKTMTVHLGPSSYMQLQDSTFAIEQGDEVTIIGSTCDFEGKEVLMASKIRNEEGKTLELRDNAGSPEWDKQDNRPDNRNPDIQAKRSDRRSDRTDQDNRVQPSPNQSKR